ncbi:MAG TPA: metallophosphoesterase [Micropepsaceae bacterium]|nr:metallophosphoesterase [Micropepsaceae bacterium]
MRRIAQISDLHFGSHDSQAAEDLLASLSRQHADLVVASGDFTQRAHRSEFAEARLFLDAILQPKLVVPGNHDLPLYNLLARVSRPLKHFHRYLGPHGQPGAFFEDEEIAVMGLNTARRFPGKGGRVSFEQIGEMRQVFGKVHKSAFKALVTHHPLGYPTGEKPLGVAGRSGHALKALSALDVHLLFSGHGHRPLSGALKFEMAADRSILVLHAGTAISTRTRDGHGNTYNLIDIDGAEVAVRIMEWSRGHGFAERQKTGYRVQDGSWQRISR